MPFRDIESMQFTSGNADKTAVEDRLKYLEYSGPSVMQMYKSNKISQNVFEACLKLLRINGFKQEEVYDMPYSYIEPLLKAGGYIQ